MANVFRIGIVGCGRIARGSHAPGFAAVPGTRITALCDLDKSRTAAIRDAQGGLVLDIGIHMADLLAWIAGPVVSVAALVDTRTPGIDVPDHVGALFRFASGASGVLELSWSLPVGGSLLEIYGSEGRLRVGFDCKNAAGSAGIELARKSTKGTHVSYPRLKRGTKSSYACFVAAVKGRLPCPTPGELGREALAICDAIVKSGTQHRFVNVKSFKDDATQSSIQSRGRWKGVNDFAAKRPRKGPVKSY